MKKLFLFLAALAVFGAIALFNASEVWAANGQVAGQVLDKKTKEPIIGANIRLLLPNGSKSGLGARTDIKGNYLILNVPPGLYQVEIRAGDTYTAHLFKEVKIETDGKVKLETVSLADKAIEGDTVTVIAGQKAEIRKEIPFSQTKIGAPEIEKLPIRNVQDLLTLQVGVTTRNGQIHIRGGRSDETVFIIDGVEVRNILTGSSGRGQSQSDNMSVPTTAIQEFTLLKGGFDAQYGNATSGVINISTKEGNTERTRFHVEYFTDRFGSPTLNKYSFNSDQIQLSMAGPEPLLGWVFPKLLKWNTEGKVAYFASLQMDKTDTHLSYNKFASVLTQKSFPTTNILGIRIPDREQNSYNTQLKFTIRPSGLLKLNVDWKNEFLTYNYVGSDLRWNYRYSPGTAPVVNDRTTTFSITAEHTLSKNSFYRAQISHFYKNKIERPGDPNNPRRGKNPDLFLFEDQFESFTDLNNDGVWFEGEPFADAYREDTTEDGGPIYTQPNPITGFAGDPFTDRNGNGVYDGAEPIPPGGDSNGNGRFDPERANIRNVDFPEPFRDGDIILGEPFIDMNKNGVFNAGVDRFITCNCPENQDFNFNSQWDGPGSAYTPNMPFRDLNGNGLYDEADGSVWEPGEPYIDVNGNGEYDFGGNGFVNPGTYVGTLNFAYVNEGVKQTTAKFDFNSQIGSHYFSSGVQADLTKLSLQDIRRPTFRYNGIPDGQIYGDRGIFRDFYVHRPIIGNVYLGDRVEYGQLIANLSLRYDFFLQTAGLNAIRTQEQIGQRTPEPIKNRLAPRMGFSYPISERAKLFFNYGHYYQLPNLSSFYRRATQSFTLLPVGNFNLDYTKKIKYEFGNEVLLSDNYRMVLTGFYNDDFGLLNTRPYGVFAGTILQENFNSDYGRTRGVEGEISRVGGGYFQGFLTYTFSIAQGKSSSETSNQFLEPSQISLEEVPLDWDQRHQLTLNLNVNVANGDHPQLFGLKMPDNWNLNVIWQYGSGFPFTPGTSFPGLAALRNDASRTNSLRIAPNSRVDLRFQKSFRVWRQDYTFQLWVNNVLDRQNPSNVHGNTGRTTSNQVARIDGFNTALPGIPFENFPGLYETGRNIKMGISVDF